jgi:hypothetical protein
MRQRPLASLTLSAALRTPTAFATEAKPSTPVAMLHDGLRVSAVAVGSPTEMADSAGPGCRVLGTDGKWRRAAQGRAAAEAPYLRPLSVA